MKLQIYQLSGLLETQACDILIKHGENYGQGYLIGFYGFTIEAILNKIEKQTQNLTGLPIENQEPLYLERIVENKQNFRYDCFHENHPDYNKEIKKGGNRLFSVVFYLTDTSEIFFPEINMKKQHKKGDGLIWNNMVNGKPTKEISYMNNGSGWIAIKWIREKEFK